jgi:hypothetical protein
MPGAQSLVVPDTAVNADATGATDPFPGTYLKSRQQILLDANWLSALPAGAPLNTITFRRDGSDLRALRPGRAALTLSVSSRATPSNAASEVFALNPGPDARIVFQGEIALPSSPALQHRNEPDWGPQHSFRLPFSQPLPYAGGTLCIDIEGNPVQATRWPIDYHTDLQVGRTQRLGVACGPVSAISTKTARVSDYALRPGASMTFQVMGERNSLGILMLGANHYSPPLSLSFLGAPGCFLHVDPLLTLWSAVTPRPGRAPNHPGIGHVQLQMPHQPGIVGSVLYAQWLNIWAANLSASDGLQLMFAGGVVPYGAATVTSARSDGLSLPASGRVAPGHAPVVRLAY